MVRNIEVTVDALGRCDVANAARALNKSVSCLNNWRVAGIGPRWFKLEGRVYYLFDDLKSYGRGETSAQAA